jgi:hypothetical protein
VTVSWRVVDAMADGKNAEAWELLPLGEPPFNYERWKARRRRRDEARRT